ncbi:MAG: hypothetical protein HY204_08615 [Nitrospirae bacterium]|nr:hypothetical protein [Nitrospirota bacterium]
MRRPGIAVLLSAVVPGLGQFYNRHWLKGGGFIAGTGVLFWLAGEQFSVEALMAGDTSGVGKVLGLLLAISALLIWSMVDAYHSAKTPSTGK